MASCSTLLTVLVLIHSIGGLLGAEVSSAIIGGQDASVGRWPWMVHLNIMSRTKDRWRCGGTILNSRWVLTAASCWDRNLDPDWSHSMAWVGTHSLRRASARYMGIHSVTPHSQYRTLSTGYENNIALVKLSKDIRFQSNVAAVKLPSADDTFDSTSECWITGWGDTATNVPLHIPETLQELEIPIVSQSRCKARYPNLPAKTLCAGDTGKDACKGDYGGPLVCRTGKGYVQAGIMSYESGEGCGLAGRPGVYTKVSNYLRFINDYIHQDEEDCERPRE